VNPSWAGHAAVILGDLRPVGGAAASFRGAASLTSAVETLLTDRSAREDLVSLTLSVAERFTNSNGSAALVCSPGRNAPSRSTACTPPCRGVSCSSGKAEDPSPSPYIQHALPGLDIGEPQSVLGEQPREWRDHRVVGARHRVPSFWSLIRTQISHGPSNVRELTPTRSLELRLTPCG